MKKLNNPNVIKLHEVIDDDSMDGDKLYMGKFGGAYLRCSDGVRSQRGGDEVESKDLPLSPLHERGPVHGKVNTTNY